MLLVEWHALVVLNLRRTNTIDGVAKTPLQASYGLGRYTLGLLWYKMLTGNDVINNTFSGFDEEITETEIKIAKKC